MTNAYHRIALSDRIGYSEILDPKFKTNTIKLVFYQPLSPETASACALACDLATSSNHKYPSNEAMNRKLHLLYGADLGFSVSQQGDLQMLTIHGSALADRYALDGEPVLDALVEIVLDCLTDPNVTEGAFDAAEFRMKQQELLDAIDGEINEKRVYAIRQARKTIYQNEPAAHSAHGTREEALALTASSTYEAFQTLLRTATVEIFFVGPTARPDLPEKFKAAFDALGDAKATPVTYLSPSPMKDHVVTVTESLPVNQCKLVMAWKTADADRYAVKLMALLLGGTPSAKLFANVREKMSLCYYCAANYSEFKQTLLVDSGIETENLEKTQHAIAEQLDALRNGEITDEELNSALMFVHNSLQGVGDTPNSYISWYLGQLCHGTNLTPSEEEGKYQAVTRAQLVEAANAFQLDTLYTLTTQDAE